VIRTVVDPNLMEWEVFASTPRGGLPSPGRILFRSVSDDRVRTRARDIQGTRSDAESRIERATPAELQAFLAEAQEIG
jgi:hypothetical protein